MPYEERKRWIIFVTSLPSNHTSQARITTLPFLPYFQCCSSKNSALSPIVTNFEKVERGVCSLRTLQVPLTSKLGTMSQDLLQVVVAKIKLLSSAMAWNKHEFGNIFVLSKYNCVKSWYSQDDCLQIVNMSKPCDVLSTQIGI